MKDRSQPTDGEVRQYKEDMKSAIVGKFSGNLSGLDTSVIQGNPLPAKFNGLIGEIFVQWIVANSVPADKIENAKPVFIDPSLFKKSRRADLSSGTTIIEVKAIADTKISGQPVPSAEQREQAMDYAEIVKKPIPGLINVPGGAPAKRTFTAVEYRVNNDAVKAAWEPVLQRIIPGVVVKKGV